MSVGILKIFLIVLLAMPAFAETAAPFEYGPRPPLWVFDPSGFLEPAVVKEISDPLAAIHDTEHLDIIVVILTDLAGAPPEHVARRFATAWCKLPNHAVVLHVPGRKDSPWIVPEGLMNGLIDPEEIQQAVEDAQRRVAKETTDADKVRIAAAEAANMLRYWKNTVITRRELIKTETVKFQEQARNRNRMWRLGLMLGAILLITLTVAVSSLVSLARRRGPRYFPHRAWQFRLGAPHAGGNHAVVKIGGPPDVS